MTASISGMEGGVYWLIGTGVLVALACAAFALRTKANDRRDRQRLRALRRADGQALIEYALIITLVVLIGYTAYKVF